MNEEALRRELQERYITIDELGEVNNLLRAVLNSVNYGICHLKDGKIVWCNTVFEEMSGWAVSEIAGKETDVLFMDKDLWLKFRQKVLNALLEKGKLK
jgi:PAS fold.